MNAPAPIPGAKDFVQRSNLKGLVALSRDLLVLISLFAIGFQIDHWLAYLLLAWPIGLMQFNLGEVLAHEASHYNLFRTRSWNDRLEWLLCFPFLYTLSAYRAEHRLHHIKLGTSEDHLITDYRRRGLFRIPPMLIWIWFGKPLVGLSGAAYLRSVLLELMNKRAATMITLLWSTVLTLCGLTGTLSFFFWLWVLPLIWTFPSFLWWSEIRDHFNTATGTRSDISWINHLTHNNGFHHVHHQYPSIPWYLLREAHETLIGDHRIEVSNGFFDTFRQILPPDKPACPSRQQLATKVQ
jgi:fatty acid desaturase